MIESVALARIHAAAYAPAARPSTHLRPLPRPRRAKRRLADLLPSFVRRAPKECCA